MMLSGGFHHLVADHPSMDPFSYLSFLTSIVLALGITRVMTGIGELLQTRT